MKRFLFGILAASLLFSCSDIKNASMDSVLKKAENGDAEAQVEAGMRYYNGNKEVEKNFIEAAHWFRMAAEQGNAEGQYHLGNMYYNGEGEKKDAEAAVRLYRKAAMQGYVYAQYALGISFKEGNGIEKNLDSA
ncbi:MAG: sel1 repeat family protein, partial [Paludibacteraceae bacterium]|nr:sel1 repeat family protein [Paludibacteraceae bacterium]